MPGDVRRVLFDEPTGMVHVLGTAPDGVGRHDLRRRAARQRRLRRRPSAVHRRRPGRSTPTASIRAAIARTILAASADGTLASVDIGDHAFAWRLPGVIAGALMAGLIFLLVRILFRRREVAVIAAILVLVDGMLFVQSGSR